MADDDDRIAEAQDEEGGDGLCDDNCSLEDHELTGDHELPAATGGVADQAGPGNADQSGRG